MMCIVLNNILRYLPKHISAEVVLMKDLVVYLVDRGRDIEMELGCVDGCCDVTPMDVVEAAMISTDESEVRTELDEVLEKVAVDETDCVVERAEPRNNFEGGTEERNCVVNGTELDAVYMEEVVAVVT